MPKVKERTKTAKEKLKSHLSSIPEVKQQREDIFAGCTISRVPVVTKIREAFAALKISNIKKLCARLVVLSKEDVPFNAELAWRLLRMSNFHAERVVRIDHVIYLMRQMAQGTFRWEHVTLMVCAYKGKVRPVGVVYNGDLYRINGMHTCIAFLALPDDIQKAILASAPTVRMISYEAKSYEDMRHLYASTDSGAPRTRGHKLMSLILEADGTEGIKRPVLDRVSKGVTPWLGGFGARSESLENVVYMMRTTIKDIVRSVCDFQAPLGRDRRFVHRAPVVAAMLETFHACRSTPRRAMDFWAPVVSGENLGKNDPRLILREKLNDHTIAKSVKSSGKKGDPVHGEVMFNWCVEAWNLWRTKSPLVFVPKPRYEGPRLVAVMR